jgi:ABC-type sugar transport system ATPase subunit
MSEWILEMKNISKAFPGTQALSAVNFELKPGEIHALIGENGAGKSTLMNILVGIHRMDEGEIIFNGKKIENLHPYEALSKGIGIVPQEINLIPEVSVAENIFLGKEIKKKNGFVDWKETERQAVELLARLDVNIDVHQKLGDLSAAFQQLVSIARLLASGSNVLIMDEPTAALTMSETHSLFKSMRNLRVEGKSIIFISHHLEEVVEICDRVTIMRDSRVVHKADIGDITIEDMIFYMANRRIEKNVKVVEKINSNVYFEIKNLSRAKEFKDISFQVRKGEILGIAGLVGSGRTELVRCIFGLTKKDSGKIFLEGKEIDINAPYIAIENGMGYIPEERRKYGIFPNLSVSENMMMPSFDQHSTAGLIKLNSLDQQCSHYVEELKIKTSSNAVLIKNLSGGNQQKVIISRWMAKGIKLLILDEPTRGIDVNAKGEIHRLIKTMAKSGVTVIVVSSELEEVINLSDRIMVMFEGNCKGFVDDLQGLMQEDILRIALQ